MCPAAWPPQSFSGSPNFATSYACNPNYFFYDGDGTYNGIVCNTSFAAFNVQSPSQRIAVGDATQNPWSNTGRAWADFSWSQTISQWSPVQSDYADLDFLIPPDGLYPGGCQSDAYLGQAATTAWECGLRYRHGQSASSLGVANALFFDGHVSAILANHNPGGAVPSSATSGINGLKIFNVINPAVGNGQYPNLGPPYGQ